MTDIVSRLPIRDEARRTLALAWPVILTSLNWTLLHLTDIVFVGMTGTHETAAFGGSRTLSYIVVMIEIGALTGILVYAARADGARDGPATGRIFREGLLLATVLSTIGAAPLYFGAEALLRLAGVADGLIPKASRVVEIMALAMPAQLIIIAASNFLEGISKPRRVMIVNLSILPANALLAWAWSGGHLGLPRLGAAGAALATATCLWAGAVAMLVAVLTVGDARARDLYRWRAGDIPAIVTGALRLAGFGLVPAIASGLELAGFAWLIALSTQLGDVPTHAFQIIFSLHNLTFGFALGFGSAAGVRVGNAVGAGMPEEARRRTMVALAMALAAMLFWILVYGLGSRIIVGAFPAEPAVHAIALMMLAIWLPWILFDGAQIVFTYALRSLGDQVVAGINNITAFFLVTGLTGWLLVQAGWCTDALVIASGAGMVTAALLNGLRFARITGERRHRGPLARQSGG